MTKELQQELEAKGIYFTHLVKELVTLLVKSNRPLSIEEIQGIFAKKSFFPHFSSIYRQLKRLTGFGLIEESIFSDGARRYCFIHGKDHHHHHFSCNECGAIQEVEMGGCEQFLKPLYESLRKKGCRLLGHSMTLTGICKACEKK